MRGTFSVWVAVTHFYSYMPSHGVERMEFLHRLLDKLDWAFAGLVGAIVASWWHKDDLTSKQAWAIFLITGVSCALYLTGIVSGYFGITEPSNVAGVGFLLGTFGGSLMAAINRAIKAADLWALIRSKFGGGTP
jgi:paired small multidrug resistance pump